MNVNDSKFYLNAFSIMFRLSIIINGFCDKDHGILSTDTKFLSLGLDNLDILEIVMIVEDEASIHIDDSFIESLTVKDVGTLCNEIIRLKLNDSLETPKVETPKGVKKLPLNNGKRWTEKDFIAIHDSFKNGCSINSIAYGLGRTNTAVLAKMVEFGLLTYNRKRKEYYTKPQLYYKG